MSTMRTAFCGLLGVSTLAGLAHAHHSVTANFDTSREVEIRGTVVDFNYVSPHASLVIDGIGFENGEALSDSAERWEIESSAVKGLASRGIMRDTIHPGDEIIVRGAPHRNASLYRANSSNFFAADGRPLGAAGVAGAEAVVAPAVVGVNRVEGRWRPPFQPNGEMSALPLNETGLEAWNNYDQAQSPANTCEPMSLPVVMNAPSYFVDIRFRDGEVAIYNEAYDVDRAVRLGDEFALADPNGQWGNVRGRIDGDTLVVDSKDYPVSRWGLGAATQVNGAGADVPSSPEKTLTERFSTSDDGLELYYDYTLYDPVYMSRPHDARIVLQRAADDAPMYPYNCNVDAARQFSRGAGESVLSIEE